MPRYFLHGAIYIIIISWVAAGHSNVTFSQDWRDKADPPGYAYDKKNDFVRMQKMIKERDSEIENLRDQLRAQEDRIDLLEKRRDAMAIELRKCK